MNVLQDKTVAHLLSGASFGELALMHVGHIHHAHYAVLPSASHVPTANFQTYRFQRYGFLQRALLLLLLVLMLLAPLLLLLLLLLPT